MCTTMVIPKSTKKRMAAPKEGLYGQIALGSSGAANDGQNALEKVKNGCILTDMVVWARGRERRVGRHSRRATGCGVSNEQAASMKGI
jgi:hypothetical protein